MPTFGRTDSGKWHIVGPDGCRYGRAFGDDDPAPTATVTATDIVAYQSPEDRIESEASNTPVTIDETVGRGSRDEQRLVLPRAIRESDSDLCGSCRSTLERQQARRKRVITTLKRNTPIRDVEWEPVASEDRQRCFWCRSLERTLRASDDLDCRVCPACARLYESPLGDPGEDGTPDGDRRPATPAEPVVPIVLGSSPSDDDATELVGSNRPVIEWRAKSKYGTLKLSLERTGHAFTPAAIDAFERRSQRVPLTVRATRRA